MTTTSSWDSAALPLVLRVTGEVDLLSSLGVPEVLAVGTGRPPCRVDVDASAVTFLDPAGLSVLLVLAARLRAAGHRVGLCRPSAAVVRLLALTGTADLLPVHGSATGGDDGPSETPVPELVALHRSHLFRCVERLVHDGTTWDDPDAGPVTSQQADDGAVRDPARLAARSVAGEGDQEKPLTSLPRTR